MAKTFLIADTHFGHERIISFENRPFKNVKEMNSILIANWNKTVSPEDIVYILGDFGYGKKDKINEWIYGLNGYKILVMGNHDRELEMDFIKESAFDEVINYPIIYKEWFILSHEPVYLNHNMPYANIYGHVHSNPSYQDYSPQSFCVSVERINYTPIEFDEIVHKMKSLL